MKIIQIKNFNNDILKQIEQIEFSSFKRPWSRKEIVDDLSNHLSFSFIIINNNEILGYLLATKIFEEISINKLCIKKVERNRGYGTKLLEFFINEAYEENIKTIYLEVNIFNKKALDLYKKNGFQINRTRKYSSSDDNIVYEMKKNM